MSETVLEPHEVQQAIRDLQKQVLYLEERMETLEAELEDLKPEEEDGWSPMDEEDEEEDIEPVS